MKPILTKHAVVLLAAVAVGAFPATASAGDRDCVGGIGPEVVEGNVHVPEGASCGLAGTVVLGSVYAHPTSRLTAVDVTLHGNLQTTAVDTLVLEGDSFVFGSVQVLGGLEVVVDDARIIGSAEFIGANGSLTVTRNSVTGNVLVSKNFAVGLIAANSVGGNLSCFDNEPPPLAVANVVRGNTEGQCQEAR